VKQQHSYKKRSDIMIDADGAKPTFDFRAAYEAKTDELAAAMRGAKVVTGHGPTIGDASETGWRRMLTEFLPSRYQVNKAFVVDSHGNQSGQIDVVVHDRHFTPLFWEIDGALFVPAESVYAVFEVKQELTAADIEAAAKKAASVQELHRTSARVVHAGGVIAEPKAPPRILAGILAGRSSWSPPLGPSLRTNIGGRSAAERLDLGCALQDGSFEVPAAALAEEALLTADPAVGLAHFAMRLMARLQAMGTVPAIDIDLYTAGLTEGQR
jgi:hypothetical protein